MAARSVWKGYLKLAEVICPVSLHAAASTAEVSVSRVDEDGRDSLRVTVRDNGRGLVDPAAVRATRFGMLGMRERAEALGGRLEVAGGEGGGLSVGVVIPLVESSVRPPVEAATARGE